jgi:mannose-6-phosphate isomerase-like protein (cupin superfamily)
MRGFFMKPVQTNSGQETTTDIDLVNHQRRQLLSMLSLAAGASVAGLMPEIAAAKDESVPLPRRLVTGRDEAGKSVVKSFDVTPRVIHFDSRPEAVFYELYATDGVPQLTGTEVDPILNNQSKFPTPGQTLFRLVQFPPQSTKRDAQLNEKFREEFAQKLPDIAQHLERDNPGMHTSDTLDYGIVVQGEMILELDDGQKVHLRQGDTLVQNGTRHRWINPLSEPSLVAFVLIGGKRET